ncbi:hypothetical protein Ait01nite_028950 [Actinoplanes italicus]|uniref:Uncharacterized protein n=1 Tax=Actinoplanes italicus TaxID=113567 RepID=A0A2T0KIJ9_9ACTN|nr:hypothetical protein [Actinoplanes italicus]PRX23349.1 hypothetical protein CLV67_10394 [Actinoplanes italicus]GIE29850.1 hypothetical protein Ait01nite_028950 [Actinoplanes italicus]
MAVLTTVALGGCAAEEPPRIPLGAARPATPITPAGEPDGTGLLPIADWPAACDLLPEPAIREILPAATVVEMKRARPVSTGSVLPDDAACHIGIDFSGVKRPESGAYPAYIHVTIRAAGTPEAARRGYRGGGEGCSPELLQVTGLDDCGRDDAGWTFLKGGIAGELSDVAPVLNSNVRFEGQEATMPAERFWRDTVETEVLKAVAARLP